MKVVLDTNVVVSAFLSPAGNCAVILQLALRHDTGVNIYFSSAVLAEYEEVLCRSKFAGRINLIAVQRFFEILYKIGTTVHVVPSHITLPDEADRKFYDIAKKEGAYLVTGNIRHYPTEPFVVEPADFLRLLTS